MAQHVDVPPEEDQQQHSHPLPGHHTPLSKAGIISLLVIVGMLLISFTSLLLINLSQGTATSPSPAPVRAVAQPSTTPVTGTQTPSATANQDDVTPPLVTPDNAPVAALQMPAGHYVVYEQQKNMYVVSTTGGTPQPISTPGYSYNQSVRPILTPNGQLLYSGDGLWLADIFGGTATQIASLDQGQVITSMAMSSDGKMIAWSTAPSNGTGVLDIYAGSLINPVVVYEQPVGSCPCFRVFSFMNGHGRQGNTKLLLTDDRGSLQAIQQGLWSINLAAPFPQTPQLLLDEDPQQGPLALGPYENTLLYSSYEGVVPLPTDGSVPAEFAALTYANSLNVATLDGQTTTLSAPQVLLQAQQNLTNSAAYHWITTPLFSPDGHMLIYVEFSSDPGAPYDRHSALYTAQISSSGSHLSVSKPTLLATSTDLLTELGAWLNDHILTFYSDGVLYALDIQNFAVSSIANTGSYTRIIAVTGTGRI